MFFSIKSAIYRFSKRPEVEAALQEQDIKAFWSQIAGKISERASEQTEVIGVTREKELVVRVKNHLWLQELSLYQNDLKREASRRLKDIASIRFVT